MTTTTDINVAEPITLWGNYYKEITTNTTAGQAALVTAVALLALYMAPVPAFFVGIQILGFHACYKFEQAKRQGGGNAGEGVESLYEFACKFANLCKQHLMRMLAGSR